MKHELKIQTKDERRNEVKLKKQFVIFSALRCFFLFYKSCFSLPCDNVYLSKSIRIVICILEGKKKSELIWGGSGGGRS